MHYLDFIKTFMANFTHKIPYFYMKKHDSKAFFVLKTPG